MDWDLGPVPCHCPGFDDVTSVFGSWHSSHIGSSDKDKRFCDDRRDPVKFSETTFSSLTLPHDNSKLETTYSMKHVEK